MLRLLLLALLAAAVAVHGDGDADADAGDDHQLRLMTPEVLSLRAASRNRFNLSSEPLGWTYVRHLDMATWLGKICSHYQHLCNLTSIGKSVEGRDLLVVKIAAGAPDAERPLGRPLMKFVGNIHGNEALSRQLLLYLTQHLLTNYQKDEQVTRLLERTELHILPSMNPDGFERAKEGDCPGFDARSGRLNANSVDLNRDFPDRYSFHNDTDRDSLVRGRQPETVAVMTWLVSKPFVLSAALHAGSVVASYPYDDSASHVETGHQSPTPDDPLFRHLAAAYADNHATMRSGRVCQDDFFVNGTTNGAEWYDVANGMQDFNYEFSNCFEISVELSCCKFPNASSLESEWHNNSRSLIEYAKQVHLGLKGVVLDSVSRRPIPKAVVTVDGIDHAVVTTDRGEFWRLLLPGTYNLTVRAYGYNTLRREMIEVVDTSQGMSAQWLDLEMDEVQQKTGPPDIVRNESTTTADTSAHNWTWNEFTTKPAFVHRNFTQMEAFLKRFVALLPRFATLAHSLSCLSCLDQVPRGLP